MKKKNTKKESPVRLDFNTHTREIVPIYEVSPDKSQVRTDAGWVSAYRQDVITMRNMPGRGFMSDGQVEFAVRSEQEMLREKKYKDTGAYIIAKAYPIKKWIKGEI